MSVAQDDSGHHRAYDPSTNPSRIPQEYGNNNAISSILNKDVEGDSRRSTPLPNSSNQNSNKPIVESTPSDNGLSQSHRAYCSILFSVFPFLFFPFFFARRTHGGWAILKRGMNWPAVEKTCAADFPVSPTRMNKRLGDDDEVA